LLLPQQSPCQSWQHAWRDRRDLRIRATLCDRHHSERSGNVLYVTGDTHARIDIGKLEPNAFEEGYTLAKDDYLVVAGDFGALWSGGEEDEELLDWWEARPWTTLFVDGNHENFDLLGALPVREWHGGQVGVARPSVLHLRRGQLFDLCGLRVFAMGGAVSDDRFWRREGHNWWPAELPSDEERAAAWEAIERAGWQVDCVISHEGPTRAVVELYQDYELELTGWMESQKPEYREDYGATHDWADWLDDVAGRLDFDHWYFGHRHHDKALGRIGGSAGDFCCLYQQVVRVA
jgi:hypothetical protein